MSKNFFSPPTRLQGAESNYNRREGLKEKARRESRGENSEEGRKRRVEETKTKGRHAQRCSDSKDGDYDDRDRDNSDEHE